MYIIGAAVYICSIILVMYFKGLSIMFLSNTAAILGQILAIVSVLIMTNSFRVFALGLKAAAFPKSSVSDDVRGRAASLLRLLSKTSALMAVLTLIISVVAALSQLSDVEALGHAISAGFAGLIWGIMPIIAIFEPAVFVLKKRR